jgi:dienelactone hydrolase
MLAAMNRRQFLQSASAGAVLGSAADFGAGAPPGELLPAGQQPPLPSLGTHWTNVFEKLSAGCRPRLTFLDDRFTDPRKWCEEARRVLLGGLHYDPPACEPRPEVVDRAEVDGIVREKVIINTTPDVRVPAHVLVPRGLQRPAPALVALHDHGGFYLWGKEKLVRVEPEHPELAAFKATYYGGRSIADELARRGFVVIVPDAMHWGERGLYFEADPPRLVRRAMEVTPQEVREFNARSWNHEELVSRTALACGATWAGLLIRDDMRVTDYLLTRPEVDRTRVGCLGLSLGSVRAIYLGAVHPAIRASVAACWMSEYQPMTRTHVRNGIGFTKLIPGLYRDLDWPDVATLHWPHALMTINGTKDGLYPLEAARAATDKIGRVFAKMGPPGRYESVYFEGPHEFNVAMQERAFEWLGRQLLG